MKTALNRRLAQCLSDLRARRGWTLDQLAQASGVSRAALSRLENAEVSPSADVLDRLAAAHGLSLSRLVALTEDGFAAHIRRDDQQGHRDQATGFTRRILSPAASGLAASVVECKLPPGTEVAQDMPDIPGQEHHLVMLSGFMRVVLGETGHDLGPGDALRYRLDGPSRFVTARGQGARYILCLVT